ncbi:4-coumarate--CoA ligase 1-like [Homarus americanus]|uniref:4-coumarate--CoA ligase 1-like n=1 Tax=Homarus americanus TaxID=6706 RepID=UPI001C45847E|nr:4-coumarate--CoA ligase 1-like [Homarus americanus]
MGPRVLEWEGPGPLPPIPDTNFAAYMLEMMEEHGDSVAVVDAETHHQRTFSELCSLVPRVSAGLAAAGVTPGEVVAVITPNHVDYPLVLLSILHRGAVCFGINSLLTPKEVNHVLKISGACWAVVHESMVAEAEAAFSLLPSSTIRKMWVLGDVSGKPSVADLMSHDPLPPFTKVDGLNPARDVAIIYSSSGTTGMPKPVKLSHRNQLTVMALNKCMDSLHQTGINRREMYEVTFMVLPMSHIYGQTNTILTLLFGGTVVVLPKFSATQFLEALQNFRVTLIPLVPFLIKFLVETPLLHRYDLSSLKVINCGAMPLSSALAASLKQKLSVQLNDQYGMTEASYAVAENIVRVGFKDNTVGKVLPYFQIKVVETESGEMLGEGQEGEVCFRGPSTMLGYANNPVATAATLDADGWIHSGDIGYFDHDNYLFIMDRLKNLIKVKGFQVSPTELESVIMEHPDVANAAVVGVPHDSLGEMPLAFVVVKPGAHIQAIVLQQFVDSRVASFKKLAGGVKFVDAIPMNPTGKINRKLLKESVSLVAKL